MLPFKRLYQAHNIFTSLSVTVHHIAQYAFHREQSTFIIHTLPYTVIGNVMCNGAPPTTLHTLVLCFFLQIYVRPVILFTHSIKYPAGYSIYSENLQSGPGVEKQ